MDLIKISKYIALLLRHRPSVGGLTLDANGWCETDCLIEAVKLKFAGFDMKILEEVVETNNKRRYSFNEDKTKIRANQGHSIQVDVNLKEQMPPDILFHGTAYKYQKSIDEKGLLKGNRLYVHLSLDVETAISVGRRHGSPIVYQVDSCRMSRDGHKFYLSENGVWLTDHVPAKYLHRIL